MSRFLSHHLILIALNSGMRLLSAAASASTIGTVKTIFATKFASTAFAEVLSRHGLFSEASSILEQLLLSRRHDSNVSISSRAQQHIRQAASASVSDPLSTLAHQTDLTLSSDWLHLEKIMVLLTAADDNATMPISRYNL